ncbi:MAG: hypothetical protein JWO36_7198 [Myxococcales bacterium]|nr:hypothetical protein [Myxococcales bacterium]
MPGGLHVATAETLPKGVVQVSTLSGFGYRKGLLGADHRFGRVIGDLAAAYAPTDLLTIGLSLDGRYDRHYGLAPSGDDGYVGDPHLNIRFAKPFGTVRAGLQVGVWVPGKNAPSVAASAISVDARVLVSLPAGPGMLSFDAGFRLDNSAKSVDDATKLSLPDRVSLGVSNYNAVFGGAHLMIPAGNVWVGVEGSLDKFIGSAPAGSAELAEGSLTLRGALDVGLHINEQWSALAFLELAKVPGVLNAQVMTSSIPLIPYEPIFTAGLGLQARFGGAKRTPSLFAEKDCHKHVPPDCVDVKVPVLADITGSVVDSNDKPVVGAKVSVTLKNSTVAPVATDDKGVYVFKGVPIGTSVDNKPTIEETGIEVAVDLSNMKPGKATVAAVQQGSNAVPPIKLEPLLPPGQLRAVVRGLPAGKAVVGATVTITPGDAKAETGADGTFSLDLPPGTYKATVKAPGYAPQELDVTIDPNGVAIKNIDLHK